MYSVAQSEQLKIFLLSLGTGFILGIIYDIFRAVRLSLPDNRIILIITDTVYFFLFGILSYLFILAVNKGEIRAYIIAGELIGAVFYYFSFGIAAIKVTDRLTTFIKRLFSSVFRIISAPFRAIMRLFMSFFTKMHILFEKTEKKTEKTRKKVLPKYKLYVYNLYDILFCNRSNKMEGSVKSGKKNN